MSEEIKHQKPPNHLRGNKAERVAKQILESEGWTVHRANRVTYRSKNGHWKTFGADIWGAIDLLAMHPENGYKAIQIGTWTGVPEHRRKIEKLPWPVGEPLMTIEMWETRAEWNGRKAQHYFRVHRYSPGAKNMIENDKSGMTTRIKARFMWDVLPDMIKVPQSYTTAKKKVKTT